MAYSTGILFGRITKVNSYDGSVTVRLERNFIENIPEMGSVFVEIEGRPVPFFISDIDYPGAEIIRVTIDDYRSPEKLNMFRGCRVFLTSHENDGDLSGGVPALEGFTVMNQDKIVIGKIREIIENPGQLMIEVISPSEKEILIPLHDDLIISVNQKKKIMVMNIPEGLTELN